MSVQSYALHEDLHCKHYAEPHKPVNKKGKKAHTSPKIWLNHILYRTHADYFHLSQDPMSLTNADNAFTLYYVKFRAAAPKVRVSIKPYSTLKSLL